MIRQAEKKDVSRIAEIIVFGKRIAYRPIFNNDVVSFNELQVFGLVMDYFNNLDKLNDLLVYDDGIIKGVINRHYTNNSLEICELYVEPFFKGNGIGRKLISNVIESARQENIYNIYLWVIEDNVNAINFYERNGFVKNGKTMLIDGTEKTDLCYELILAENPIL